MSTSYSNFSVKDSTKGAESNAEDKLFGLKNQTNVSDGDLCVCE